MGAPRTRLGLGLLGMTLLASACSLFAPVGPDFKAPVPPTAPAWQAPLPHGGSALDLARWWQQFEDPLLVALIDSAQRESATIAQASARIAQSQAALVASGAAIVPSLDVAASTNRAAFTFGGPVALRTQTQIQFQTAWEIDLFGGNRREREAARARLDARSADWHDARVSVAAEVANLYLQYRFCEQQVQLAQADALSRRETDRLTDIAARAGLQAPSNAALARASAAEASNRVIAQRAECTIALKGLTALTGLDEPALTEQLRAATARLPRPREFRIEQVPANVIMQRPDLAAIERDLAAASADIGVAEAARYPRLSISGAIGPLRFRSNGQTLSTTTWSIGPTLNLPLFDAGRRAANADSAKVAYAAAEAAYRQRVRQAVKEVEEALVRLGSVADREADAQVAADGYRASLLGAQTRWTNGLGTLIELEESRRLSLTADATVVSLQRDRVAAWIALYRAMGGGWDRAAADNR